MSKGKILKPPRYAKQLLSLFFPHDRRVTILRDLEEGYMIMIEDEGVFHAKIWYLSQIVKIVHGKLFNKIYWGAPMFKNYIKIAFRNMKRHKGYSFINITGLAVGMACCILILLWVQDEMSYDKFHEYRDRLYRIVDHEVFANGSEIYFTSNPPALGPTLMNDYPEIVNTARIDWMGGRVVRHEDRIFQEDAFARVDPSLFEMFSFPLIAGDPKTALSDPYGIIITEDMAVKYFGNEDPIGRTLRVDNRLDFHVTGIIRNIPHNSHMRFDFAVPFQIGREFGELTEGWNSFMCRTYVLLDENANMAEVDLKIGDVIKRQYDDIFATISLQPIQDIHLYSSKYGGAGDIKTVILFSIIAGFVLLTACINFMNLSTARSGSRSLEIGLRKVVGAGRKTIIGQFYGETIVLSFLALIIALILVVLILPPFNQLAGKQLSIHLTRNINIWLILLGTVVFTGLIAGSYPALFLSSFQPIQIIAGTLKAGSKSTNFRRLLVTVQFVLTSSLIIGTIVMNRQLHFIRTHKLGFNKEQVLCVQLQGDVNRRIDPLKNEFMKHSNIMNASAVSTLPTMRSASVAITDWEGKNTDGHFLIYLLAADHDYINTMQMEMKEGRFFSRKFPADTVDGVIVNEAAVRIMGMESPLGKRFEGGRRRIVGVIKDFHFHSLHRKIDPLMITCYPDGYRYLLVKIGSNDIKNSVHFLRETWERLVPEFPFEFQFLDDHFDRLYRADVRMEKIINAFTLITLFIASLGLFGLASFTAEQRTKEIGIRRVLGASIPNVIFLLGKEFTKWVLAANLIAWPVGYFATSRLLASYAYRIRLSWWIFVLSGILALIISFITVGFQAVKTARANPVDSLRYE